MRCFVFVFSLYHDKKCSKNSGQRSRPGGEVWYKCLMSAAGAALDPGNGFALTRKGSWQQGSCLFYKMGCTIFILADVVATPSGVLVDVFVGYDEIASLFFLSFFLTKSLTKVKCERSYLPTALKKQRKTKQGLV